MTDSFAIQPLSRFVDSSGIIRRPKEVAWFSYDDDHIFHLDQRALRYYYPPRLGADLSRGYDTFQQLDDKADDHLDSLLSTIMDLEKRTATKSTADFVTWRGMMTKIMAAPFDNMNGFEMNATKFQVACKSTWSGRLRRSGTNYCSFIEENHEHKLELRKQQHAQPSRPGAPSQDLMSFWGYKFETLSVLPDQWDATPREFIENREDVVVNNYAQYCSVVKTGVGKAKMLIGGEVDAIWDCKPDNRDDPINWVELKTSAEISNDRDMLKYERKLLKFWIQSFLLGVPKIIVGFRSQHGVLQRLEELETKNIPGMVKRQGKGTWDGNLCIKFTATFLEWLKQTINSGGIWRIRRRERSAVIEVFKVEESGYGDILLPAFVEWRNGEDANKTC
ncbi:RAI1 like PD-XK nuclease-domain-containing protein [Usnea florida]